MEANNKIADLFVRRMRLEMLSKEVRVRFKTSGCYVATFGVKQYQGIFLMNIGITPINQFAFTTKPYRFRLAILIVFIVV